MNKYARLLFSVFLLSLASPLLAQNSEPRVAVMPLSVSVEGAQLEQLGRLSKGLSEVLSSALAAQDLQPVTLGDGALALSDASAQAQARSLGADYIFHSRVLKNGERFNLTGQLLALTPEGRSSRRQTLTADNTTQFPQTLERLVLLTTDHLSGGGAPVISVDITGNTMMSSQAILNALRLQPGGNYNETKATSDIKRIYAMGYFDDVQVRVENLRNGKAVHFIVRERPQLDNLVFRGNEKFDDEALMEAAGLKPHDIPSERAVADSVENLRNFYAKKGYNNVQISAHLETEGNGAALVYNIAEGGKVYIKDIEFDGNEFYSNWTLSRRIETSTYNMLISWLSGSGKLNPEKLSGDAQRLESYYHNNGFLQAQVGDPLITNDEKGRLVVTFPIVEGPRFKVGQVSLGGELLEGDNAAAILKKTHLKKETWFNRELLQEDVKAIQTHYADLGYANNQVEPRLEGPRDNGEILDVVFEVRPNHKVYFDRITIVGNDRTRDKVIRRQLSVVEGDLFSASKMQKSQTNLMRSTYFEQVNLAPGPSDTDDKMNLRVEVKERPTGSFQIGGGYSSYNSLFGVVRLTQDNLFGHGRRAAIEANVGSKSAYYNLSFTDPWVFDIPLSAGFDLFNYEYKYNHYTKKSNGAAVRLGYPLWNDFYLSGRLSYEKVNITDMHENASKYIRDMANFETDIQALISLRRDTRNHFFFPTQGSVARLSYGQGLDLLGGDTDFSKYEAEGAFWLPAPFYKGASLMFHAQAGYLKEGREGGLPTYEKYMIGGINSVRGYDWYDISPTITTNGVRETIGGEKMMTLNAEFAFPLLKDQGLYGVAFYDMGNVWLESESGYKVNDLYKSVGGGLRYLSPMGPLRIEYGKPVGKRPEGSGSGQWEFTMGSMF